MTTGKFIVFEGIDGAGKSTQIEALSLALQQLGIAVHRTAEPTALDTGRMLRDPGGNGCTFHTGPHRAQQRDRRSAGYRQDRDL